MDPADAAELVGRAAELHALRAMLAEPGIVSLCGAPGVGKSALARAATDGEPRIWLDAAAARSDTLAAELCRAAGAPAGEPGDAVSRAARALDGRLLVVDGVEDRASGELVRSLVRAAPLLRVLAIGRAPLGVPRLLRLRTLGMPASSDDAAECESARALLGIVARRDGARASAIATHPLLGAVLRELDGLPLAIELAASRLLVLSVAELADALERDRFQVLRPAGAAGSGGLEAAIRSAWDALSASEQRTLELAALSASGFTVPLVTRALSHPPASVLDDVAGLASVSLIERSADEHGEARFTVPASVRAFAAAELEERGELEAGRCALARAYAELLEASAQPEGRARSNAALEADRASLLALTQRTLRDPVVALRLFGALHDFHWATGLDDRQLATLGEALERAANAKADVVARALMTRGRVLRRRGEITAAELDLKRAIQTAERAGAGELAALAGREMVWLLSAQGQLEDAEREVARAERNAASSKYALAWTELVRSQLDRHRGRLGAARERIERALVAFRRLGARFDEMLAMLEAADQYVMLGEHARGASTSEAGARLASEMGAAGASLAANFLLLLAVARIDAGALEDATAATERARQTSARIKDSKMVAACAAIDVLVSWVRGDLRAGRALLAELIVELELLGDRVWRAFYVALDGVMAAEEAHDMEAAAAIARAGVQIPEASAYRAAYRLAEAHLELSRARRALARGELRDAMHHTNAAAAAADRAERVGPRTPEYPEGAPPETTQLFETRLLARQLRAGLSRIETPERALPARRLVLTADAGRVDYEGRELPLGGRAVLRRLLVSLAAHRRAHPGKAVTAEQLIEAGWPGERMRVESALARLRMAVSRLRSAGLGDALHTVPDGYCLDETVQVIYAPE